MSPVYLWIIDKIGVFHWGRFVDLFQRDLIIALLVVIAYCQIRGWQWRKNR